MKKSKALILFSLIALLLSAQSIQAQSSSKFKKITYDVDVKCNSCKEKIGKAMAYTKGVKDCDVDVSKKQVTVTYNPNKTTKDKIKKELEKLGYKPTTPGTSVGRPCSKSCSKTKPCKK
jgi:mercuric ion binding protein